MRGRSVLVSAAATALVVLALVASGGAPWHAPSEPAAAGSDSQLVRQYPLGKRPLCCGRARASDAAGRAPSRPPAVDLRGDGGGGGGLLVLALLLPALALAAGIGWTAGRFTRREGAWLRVRPRRRWRVGPTAYRWARRTAFRYSSSRRALVPRVLDGRLGPVLVERPRGRRPLIPRARDRAAAGRPPLPPQPSRGRTVELECRPLPHHHHDAPLWQLTAVELRSQFVWADLVRRRGGSPSGQQIAAFVTCIADELSDAGERLEALAVSARARLVVDGTALPTGVRLVVSHPAEDSSGAASVLHELFVARHWRTAFVPPAAPPLDELRRQLQQWVAEHNSSADERSQLRRLPSRTPS